MARIDEEILNFIRRNGPATPIDIAQKLGANSIIVTAVLVDAVSQNRLMRSKKKVGSMKYYFYPDQLTLLQKRIADALTPQDKEILQKLMKENVVGEFELRPDEANLLSNLEDLVGGFMLDYNGNPIRCWYSPGLQEQKARETAMSKLSARFGAVKEAAAVKTQDEKIIAQLEAMKKPEVQVKQIQTAEKKVKPKAEKKTAVKKKKEGAGEISAKSLDDETNEFRNIVYTWLEKNNIDVESEKILKSGKEIELTAKVPNPFGKQTYVVRVLNAGKKPASQHDVSSIGMDAVSRRTPVIIISASGFAKNAKKYWEKELQDLVFLMSKDDLD